MIITHMLHLALSSLPILIVFFLIAQQLITFSALLLFFIIYVIGLLFFATLLPMLAYIPSFFWFLDNIWPRILMPILFFGCTYYPWKSAYALSPAIAILNALSPLTYIIEGSRAAFLGSEKFISVPTCVSVLTILCIITFYGAQKAFMKRVDYV